MAIQYSAAVRNAQLDAFETAIGTAPILRILSGSMPANCAATQTGTLLASLTLPSDWMANAASGIKAKSGTWEDTNADASGNAGYFRILDSTGTTCHMQGTISASGNGGDMILDTIAITAGQTVSVTTFSITAGNP